MIISASRRTDVPAFYLDWFFFRVHAGYCTVVNPRNSAQVSCVSLAPEDVELVVFWTRDGRRLCRELAALRAYDRRLLVHWTITGYPDRLEPDNPPLHAALEGFKALSRALGPGRVIWRYDPIFVSNLTPPSFHVAQFQRLATALRGYTRRCVVSLVDFYAKVDRRLRRVHGLQWDPEPARCPAFPAMMRAIATCARSCGMEIVGCAEPEGLERFGIAPGACIDASYIRRELGVTVSARKDPAQRSLCRCVRSRDIGAFHTCRRRCLYCYANR